MVAAKSERHCREQNIPFFRFSPELNETIAVGETDNEKLFSMIIQTKISTGSQRLSELVLLFHRIAETSLQPTTPSPTLQNDTSGQTLHHSTESKSELQWIPPYYISIHCPSIVSINTSYYIELPREGRANESIINCAGVHIASLPPLYCILKPCLLIVHRH